MILPPFILLRCRALYFQKFKISEAGKYPARRIFYIIKIPGRISHDIKKQVPDQASLQAVICTLPCRIACLQNLSLHFTT